MIGFVQGSRKPACAEYSGRAAAAIVLAVGELGQDAGGDAELGVVVRGLQSREDWDVTPG